jgi:ABC-2 type transport system permease protein
VLPDGSSYADFAIAGLLALNLTTSSMGTAVGLSTDLNGGLIERLPMLPMWRPAVLVGRSLGAAACAVIVAGTALSSAGAQTAARPKRSPHSPSSCYAISWGCACLGSVSKGPESAPVSAVTAAARDLFQNPNPAAAADAWPMQHPLAASLLWSLALLAIFAPLATRLYSRRTND